MAHITPTTLHLFLLLILWILLWRIMRQLSVQVQMSANNTHNNSVAYLILLLSAPKYGAIDAAKNPAPSAELVQTHKRLLFHSSHFLEHFNITVPEDAGPEWSALTANPNPFDPPPKRGVKNPIRLSDDTRTVIAEGLDWFYENAPATSKEDTLIKWVPAQLKQSGQAPFANAWGIFMTKIHSVLVKCIDKYLTVHNMHPDQVAQEAVGGFEDASSMLSDPILRPVILSHFVQGAFGTDVMVMQAGLQTLTTWALPGINNIFSLHVHRWQCQLEKLKSNHTKAIDAANDAWSGMFTM